MLINPLKDFDLGEQVFQVGKQLEVKDQDARGLIDIGFAERSDPVEEKREAPRENIQPAE